MTSILIEKIKPNPEQPRSEFDRDGLVELARSIKQHGLLQPILVEEHEDHYVLIAGERRLRAHELLNYPEIEAKVIAPTNHNGKEKLVYAMLENIQRSDMTPIDTAKAYKRLQDKYGLSITKIAKLLDLTYAKVRNTIILLDYDPEVYKYINSGQLGKGPDLLRAIKSIEDKKVRLKLIETIVNKQLKSSAAVNAAKNLAAALKAPKLNETRSPALEIARQNNNLAFIDEERPPSNWTVLSGMDKLPEWSLLIEKSIEMCSECLLKPMANKETCGQCPAAELITKLVRAAK